MKKLLKYEIEYICKGAVKTVTVLATRIARPGYKFNAWTGMSWNNFVVYEGKEIVFMCPGGDYISIRKIVE